MFLGKGFLPLNIKPLIKNHYITAFIFFIVIIISNQIIIQIDISKQRLDLETVNVAGKQRAYSQQITKMVLYDNEARNSPSFNTYIATLEKVLDTFTSRQKTLLEINKNQYNNTDIATLFEKNQPFFNKLVTSSENLVKNQDNKAAFDDFIFTVKSNEAQFLKTMDAIVNEYQRISEDRLASLKKVQVFFITFTSVILLTLSFFMFLPLFRKNKALASINLELEKFKAAVKKKENEKKNIENILERISKVARIGTWEVNFKENRVFMSKVTKEIHGIPQDFEIPNMEYALNFYKEGYNRDKIEEVINHSIENKVPYDVELEIITTQGKTIWIRTIGEPEYENGECIRIYGAFQDIDKLKQKERENEKIINISENISKIARIGTWEVNLVTGKLFMSKITKEIHGLDSDYELPFSSDGMHFYKEGYSRNKVKEVVTNAIENNVPYNEELELVTSDGKTVWVRTIGQPEFKDGKCIRLYGTFQDINTIKLSQLKLKNVNEELNAIFNTGPISIIRTDTKGIITYFNKGAETLLGYKSKEVVDKHNLSFLHKKEEIIARGKELSKELNTEITGFDIFTAITKTQKHKSKKWTYITKGGREFLVKLIITAIRNKEKEIIAYLGVATDISFEVDKENKLIQSNNDLEIVSQQLLKQNQQLANFAHIVSHNLRAPVSNLSSLLSLHDLSDSKEEKEVIFGKFKIVLSHLQNTLNTLVDAIKTKDKKITDQRLEEIYFQKKVAKIKEVLTSDISESEAIITTDFSQAEKITYNESYLESIMINLVSNAIRYKSPERKIEIALRTRIKDNNIQLLVSDNGLGIDLKKNVHKIFGLNKVFHRHPDSKGIGLFIIKNQIESLGGTISCVSKVNKGSTFIVTFKKD